MTVALQIPNEAEVKAACEQFDGQNSLTEVALGELMRQYPANSEAAHVLLKVAAINALCHTSIFDLEAIARHIHANHEQIDAALAAGSPEVVNTIASVKVQGKTYCFLAFATKFCSWHNPLSYPVYDSHVDHYLWDLQQQNHFASFQHADFYDYLKYRKIVDTFRDFYQLGSISYKELDKFLALQGVHKPAVAPEPVPCGPGAFDFYSGDEPSV